MLVSEILENAGEINHIKQLKSTLQDLQQQRLQLSAERRRQSSIGGEGAEDFGEAADKLDRLIYRAKLTLRQQRQEYGMIPPDKSKADRPSHVRFPDEDEMYTKHTPERRPSTDFDQPADDREQSVGADDINPMYDPEREYHDDPTVDIGMDELKKYPARYRRR